MEPGNDDVGESTETRSWERRANLDKTIAPCLWIFQSFNELVFAPDSVLETGLIATDAFNHQFLVFFGETLGFHWGVRKPVEDEGTPANGEDAISHEDSLPGLDWTTFRDEREAVCKKTSHNLLATVHLVYC